LQLSLGELIAPDQRAAMLELLEAIAPGGSERRTLRALRGAGRELTIEISAQRAADDLIARHGLSAPETSFIQKPFTPRVLLEHGRQALDRAAHSRRKA
jgi:hypothetical protein